MFGAVAGYAIRKLIKLGAIIVGLFVVALSYLSYKGWLDVKWILIEKETSLKKSRVSFGFINSYPSCHSLVHAL